VDQVRCANQLVVFVDLIVNQPFSVAAIEIIFSHKFLRCDLIALPQKYASRNLKDCLPLEEWGLHGFICSSECLIRVQGRIREEGWSVGQGAERYGLLASAPKQNAAIIKIPYPCLLVCRRLRPMLW
jgi:hypothetical protein